MKNSKLYNCNYCGEQYKPKRRNHQKYCSNSCRSGAYRLRKKPSNEFVVKNENLPNIDTKIEQKKESLSLAGIGNATAGSALANLLINFLTKDENKPATKGDLVKVIEHLRSRYFPIKNIETNHLGKQPFYDMQTQKVLYF